MKKTIILFAVLFISGLAFFACREASETQTTMPEAAPEAFWTYIQTTNPYTQWKFFPGYDGIYPGQSPHGAYLKQYVNDIAYEAIKKGEKMPSGAMIIKENYGQDKTTLMAITPMYKMEGYNPEGGDWFWPKYGPDGKAMAAGKVESCIGCHKAMGDGDYVVTAPR